MGGGQDDDLPFILYSPQVNVFIIVNHLNDIMHKEDVFLMFYLGFKGLGHEKYKNLHAFWDHLTHHSFLLDMGNTGDTVYEGPGMRDALKPPESWR